MPARAIACLRCGITALTAALLVAGCGEGAPDAPAPAARVTTDLETRVPADRATASPQAPGQEPAAYVGSADCASCHPVEAQAWSGSQHDLAIQEVSASSVLGDFQDAELEHFGKVTRFRRRDGSYVVVTDGADGEPVELEVAYVFGVDPLQQLLVRQPGGRLQALPAAWDARPSAEGGQRWFHLYSDEALSGGDPLHWTGPSQNWNHMCAECHSTQLRKGYEAGGDRYETTFEELNVGCEACHGPGSRHAAWARAAAPRPARGSAADMGLAVDLSGSRGEWRLATDAAIARRSAPRGEALEVELCARCHSRRATLSDDYVHGRPLLATHRPALLEEGLYHADGQILDEVYVYGSFLHSAMYAAGVSCSDCHEPHSLEVRGGPDAVCASCHRPEVFAVPAHHHHAPGSDAARCVSCHMPERVYMGVDARRDHGFKVPRPDLSAALGVPNACEACHTDRSAAWATAAVAEWRGGGEAPPDGFAAVLDAGRRRSPGAVASLARLADDRSQPGIVRATALELLGRQPAAPPDATLETALGSPDPLVRMAAARACEFLAPDTRVRLVAPLLRDPLLAVRVEAARVLADVPPAQWPPGQRAPLVSALAEYRAVLSRDADRPEAQLALGLLHARRGELAKAESAYRRALEIEPSRVPAAVNLADLQRMQGRDAEAERVLRAGLALTPESADLEHALGLVLVRLGRREEATRALARAAVLAPEQPRYAYVHAVALMGGGEAARALDVLEAAHRLHPGERDLLVALATFSRDAGNLEAARRWALLLVETFPEDREARSLLDSLAGA